MTRSIPIPDNLTEEQAREALSHASITADAVARERAIVVGGYSPESASVPRDQPDQIVTLTFRRYALKADPLAYDNRPKMRITATLDHCTFHRGVPPRKGWCSDKGCAVDRYAFEDMSRTIAAQMKRDMESDIWHDVFKEIRAVCFPDVPEPLSVDAALMVSELEADRRKRGEG